MHAKCLVPLEAATGNEVHAVKYRAHPTANAVSHLQHSFKFTQYPK